MKLDLQYHYEFYGPYKNCFLIVYSVHEARAHSDITYYNNDDVFCGTVQVGICFVVKVCETQSPIKVRTLQLQNK